MRLIYLTQAQVAKVDDADYDELVGCRWFAYRDKGTHSFYAARSVGQRGHQKKQRMARVILGITDPKVKVDHRNGDTLDNRRENLRVATTSQNGMNRRRQANNTSGFKGVTKDKTKIKWVAKIMVNKKTIHLGTFTTPEAASDAYRSGEKRYFGEFARA